MVWRMPEGSSEVYVDEGGVVRWTWAEDADRSQGLTEVESRGV